MKLLDDVAISLMKAVNHIHTDVLVALAWAEKKQVIVERRGGGHC